MRLISPTILDHAHCRFDDLQLSSNAFYQALETSLKAHAFPRVYALRITHGEGGTFSPRREYLKIVKGRYDFIVCAAPFGKSYFISWWLKQQSGIEVLLKLVPFIGRWLYNSELRQTYYQVDSEIMFKESIKGLVDAAIAELGHNKGMREILLNNTVTI
jgi:hypothetical protein